MKFIRRHPFVSLMAALIAVGLIWGIIDPSSRDMPELDRRLAESHCEDFVKEHIQTPSTAKFPEENTRIRFFDNKSYDNKSLEVSGEFDAQNGFGAMIRSHYDCTVHKPGLDTWELVDIQINQER